MDGVNELLLCGIYVALSLVAECEHHHVRVVLRNVLLHHLVDNLNGNVGYNLLHKTVLYVE